MSIPAAADLSGLASLARDPRLDLRPVLLRVQTDLFLAAPTRDPAMTAAFEALACGLLPALDDTAAARLARKLAPHPESPARVLELLVERGGEARHAVVASAACLTPAVVVHFRCDPRVLRAGWRVERAVAPVLAEVSRKSCMVGLVDQHEPVPPS